MAIRLKTAPGLQPSCNRHIIAAAGFKYRLVKAIETVVCRRHGGWRVSDVRVSSVSDARPLGLCGRKALLGGAIGYLWCGVSDCHG